jgi:hypothetical protein
MVTHSQETGARMQSEVIVHRGPHPEEMHVEERMGQEITGDDVKADLEARLKSAYDDARMTPHEEVAEPYGWWNLFSVGPIQSIGIPGPLLPHQVIKVGETVDVATILFLNPFLVLSPGITAASVLSNFALPYEVRYQTGNLTTWTLGPANVNAVFSGPGFNLIPGQFFYVHVLSFIANTPGLYMMNISARLLGTTPPYVNAPQFAGFARATVNIDPDLFLSPAPGLEQDSPVRFQVYP